MPKGGVSQIAAPEPYNDKVYTAFSNLWTQVRNRNAEVLTISTTQQIAVWRQASAAATAQDHAQIDPCVDALLQASNLQDQAALEFGANHGDPSPAQAQVGNALLRQAMTLSNNNPACSTAFDWFNALRNADTFASGGSTQTNPDTFGSSGPPPNPDNFGNDGGGSGSHPSQSTGRVPASGDDTACHTANYSVCHNPTFPAWCERCYDPCTTFVCLNPDNHGIVRCRVDSFAGCRDPGLLSAAAQFCDRQARELAASSIYNIAQRLTADQKSRYSGIPNLTRGPVYLLSPPDDRSNCTGASLYFPNTQGIPTVGPKASRRVIEQHLPWIKPRSPTELFKLFTNKGWGDGQVYDASKLKPGQTWTIFFGDKVGDSSADYTVEIADWNVKHAAVWTRYGVFSKMGVSDYLRLKTISQLEGGEYGVPWWMMRKL